MSQQASEEKADIKDAWDLQEEDSDGVQLKAQQQENSALKKECKGLKDRLEAALQEVSSRQEEVEPGKFVRPGSLCLGGITLHGQTLV